MGALALSLVAAACAGTPTPTATPTPPPLPETPVVIGLPDVPGVVERVMASVVSVLTTVEQRDASGRLVEGVSTGSGVIFDERGYILTNNHVVEGGTKVEVVLTDARSFVAEVVGRDPATDLAVLRLDPAVVSGLVATPLGDTDAMRIGEWVIAIGNPLGLAGSVTVGVVSAKGRVLPLTRNTTLYDLVQTDTVINPGNSGGPLLNLRGEVVGINTAIIRGPLGGGQEAEGIGFAISMSTAIPVSRELIANGRVIWPWLGISVVTVTPVVAAEQGLSVDTGVLVVATVPGAPAELAGIQAGDIIVTLEGHRIDGLPDLQRLMRTEYKVGDRVTVEVVRGEERLSFDVGLGEMPR